MEIAPEPESSAPEGIDPAVVEAKARFLESMDNDFNTPYASKAVFDLVREVNRRINEKTISRKGLQDVGEQLREFGEILGLGFNVAGRKPAEKNITENLIELLIEMRQKLPEPKDEIILADKY